MAKKRTSGHGKPAPGPSNPPFAVPDWPATTPKLVPLHEIVPYERNPRTHPPEQIALLAKLIQRHGVDQPIVVDEANVILKGHGRLLAAQELGLETFPVVTHHGLGEQDKRAIRIADNQVALLSGWDQALVRAEYGELKLAGYEVELVGFSEADMRSLSIGIMPLDGMPDLAAGGEPEFQQMSFILHKDEVPGVLKALKKAHGKISKTGENKNKNGLALSYICKGFMRGRS